MEDARKKALEVTNTLIEYTQRKEFVEMDRKRFLIKTKEKIVESFFLDKVYIIEENNISVLNDSKFVKSSIEELNKSLATTKEKALNISHEDLEILKKHFGDFEIGY